jgi:Delta7-sterol 5-desaturase
MPDSAALIEWLRLAPSGVAVGLFLVENIIIFLLAVAGGELLARWFKTARVASEPPPLSRKEIALAVTTILLNTVVTWAGWELWKLGVIRFRPDFGWRAWLDVAVLLALMDFAMYLLHRLAHHPLLFPLLHRMHHEYERVRPMTLFILNPFETLAFGALWLTVITIYPPSWLGMSVYLMLNVAFGTIGHLGVEPVPSSVAKNPLTGWLAGSTFHARHHHDPDINFGFYTLIWDRLFRTLEKRYLENYGRLPAVDIELSKPN